MFSDEAEEILSEVAILIAVAIDQGLTELPIGSITNAMGKRYGEEEMQEFWDGFL